MPALTGLPDNVIDLLGSVTNAEFGTVSSVGVPIDTPMYLFPSDDMQTFDVATGLSYPAKAERARNNPKVGLLFEGDAGDPVVSIAGHAQVRDTDLQANVERYIAETGHDIPAEIPWEVARKAVWYWTRIIVAITPVRILWWDNAAAMDGAPHRWDAPAGAVYPSASPRPPGELSKPGQWSQPSWPEQAAGMMASGLPAHLTRCDPEGYPLPIRARSVELTADGFTLDLPAGSPWATDGRGAKATLSFVGLSTFVGEVTGAGSATTLRVERALPIHPIMASPVEQFAPTDATYDKLMSRLRHETSRRGQPIPTVPVVKPTPTAGAQRRIARIAGLPPDAAEFEARRRR
jgi:Pyridoxamine 5'-phosphate oxidase